MKRKLMLLGVGALVVCATLIAIVGLDLFASEAGGPMTESSVLDFNMKTIDGQEVKLDSYRGNVLLLVNVASKCGYTPQYEGLEALYKKYKEQGLVVMGFPANNFFWQEPGTDEEIKSFCTLKYNVTFPMFSKISVKGKQIHPRYRFLTRSEEHTSE